MQCVCVCVVLSCVLCSVWLSPLVRVEYEEELVFTKVLWHPERLNLCKAVSEHLANARLSYRSLG